MRKRKLMILMILILVDHTSQLSDRMGPFDMIFKYPEDCSNEDSLLKLDLRVRKTSRDYMVLEGTITVKNFTVNDDMKFRAIVQQFTPSGWKENYIVFDFGSTGFCTLITENIEPSFLERYIGVLKDQDDNYIYLNETGYCNIPPGTYRDIKKPAFNLEGFFKASNTRSKLPKQFFYGKYRSKMQFFNKDFDHEIGCLFGYYDIVPKKQPKKRTNGAPSQPTE